MINISIKTNKQTKKKPVIHLLKLSQIPQKRSIKDYNFFPIVVAIWQIISYSYIVY